MKSQNKGRRTRLSMAPEDGRAAQAYKGIHHIPGAAINSIAQMHGPRISQEIRRASALQDRRRYAHIVLLSTVMLLSSSTAFTTAFVMKSVPRKTSVDLRPGLPTFAMVSSIAAENTLVKASKPLSTDPIPQKETILKLGTDGLERVLEGKGRARMVWRAVREGLDPHETDPASPMFDSRITSRTRAILQERVLGPQWTLVQRTSSTCGTLKLLVRLHDGLMVETVVIPARLGPRSNGLARGMSGEAEDSLALASRSTVCVSSQVGCAQACAFCLTGTMGFVRHLSMDEILMQVQLALQKVRAEGLPGLRNVVFMGMGEPLNNHRAVRHALACMTDPHAFALSPSFITLSTVAPSPGHVRHFLDMPKIRLAWSVHGAADGLRRTLVPTTSSSMVELREAFREVMAQRGDTYIFIEVTLIEGVNDSLDDAEALVELLRPFGRTAVKVNLIPYNDTGVNGWMPSPSGNIFAFQTYVRAHGGWLTFARTPRGREDSSACGQLATGFSGQPQEKMLKAQALKS